MAVTRVVTKTKEVLWLVDKTIPIIGRNEIKAMHHARSEIKFEDYLRRTENLI